MGPDQHAQLDGFSLFLPFPYRVAVILVAGFWGWGLNLEYLQKAKIDLPSLIRYPARHSPQQPSYHSSTYRLSRFLTLPLVVSLVIFWVATHGSAHIVELLDFIPQGYLFLLPILVALPYIRHSKAGRRHFLLSLRRVSVGGLAQPQDGKFGDILLADALTSYAKVLGDLYVSFCMFFSSDVSSTSKPNRTCGNDYTVPLIIAVPSMIRFRQCLIEFIRVRRAGATRENTGAQHLANALKYATAFPVIFLAAKMRNYSPLAFYGYSEMDIGRFLYVVPPVSNTQSIYQRPLLMFSRLICTFINSTYSFYWDVCKDWDLTLLTTSSSSPEYPFGLRRHRYFSSDQLYYLAIVIDLVIRFSWLSKFVPGLLWLTERECGLFVLVSLEVARRWMWVFFRTEAEWVRTHRGPAPDDILLGEVNGKIDAD